MEQLPLPFAEEEEASLRMEAALGPIFGESPVVPAVVMSIRFNEAWRGIRRLEISSQLNLPFTYSGETR